jgi:hypothetical protein
MKLFTSFVSPGAPKTGRGPDRNYRQCEVENARHPEGKDRTGATPPGRGTGAATPGFPVPALGNTVSDH